MHKEQLPNIQRNSIKSALIYNTHSQTAACHSAHTSLKLKSKMLLLKDGVALKIPEDNDLVLVQEYENELSIPPQQTYSQS
jgi:hypothetical protein